MERWFVDNGDVRSDDEITRQIRAFLAKHEVLSVVAVDRVIGCPHEEGIDYPDGTACSQCTFWAGRDRAAKPQRRCAAFRPLHRPSLNREQHFLHFRRRDVEAA